MVLFGKTIVCDDYEKYGTHDFINVYSPLIIFPKEKLDAVSREYYHELHDELFETKCQMYLKMAYSDEMFKNEIQRIERLKYAYMDQENGVYLDKSNYANTAYVALINWDDRYEYAIIFENVNTIIYVYLQDVDEDDVKLDNMFLPDFYEGNAGSGHNLSEIQEEHMSIYAFKIGDQYIECMGFDG